MKIVCTEKSQVLAARTSKALGVELVETKYSRFPDGELYLRTGDLDDETVIIGSVSSNDALVELLLLIDACEGSACSLVLPYLGYARQDKRFHPGEPISARAVAGVFSRGVERVFTINIHEESVLGHFGVPAKDLSLAPDIGWYLKQCGIEDPLILAPDEGASAFAQAVSTAGNWDWDELKKTRLSGVEVVMEPKRLDAAGRHVVIVDDIISTGGTLATATGMLLAQGAGRIDAACVHGVFCSGAYARLRSAGVTMIAASDSIESAASLFSVSARIAGALRQA